MEYIKILNVNEKLIEDCITGGYYNWSKGSGPDCFLGNMPYEIRVCDIIEALKDGNISENDVLIFAKEK